MNREISIQAQKDADFISVLTDVNSTEREKQKAFEGLYSKNQKQIYIYFYKNLRDADTAEDLKMVTFEKVYKKIEEYDATKAVFSTWLHKVAQNTLIDHKRKESIEILSLDSLAKKTSDENVGMDFQIASDSFTPEEEMIRTQNIKAVRQAINSIKSRKSKNEGEKNTLDIKEVMILRFIHELSFEEIGKIVGIDGDSSTLRVTVRRGKKMLKKLLQE